MTLLNRYILGQYTKYLSTVASGFVAIYLLVDFFEKIDDFTKNDKPFSLALEFFLLNIPFIIDQLGPVLILLSGVITLGILNHSNELTALKAGGIPLQRIIKPIAVGAILSTLLFLAMAQWILPRTISITNKIWYEDVGGMLPLGIYRNGRYYYKGEEGFYSFQWPNPEHYIFKDFSYSRWNDDYNLEAMVTAQWADWKNNRWICKIASVQKRLKGDNFKIRHFDLFELKLPETPDHFFVPKYQSAEMSLLELFLETFKGRSDREKREAWVNFSSRLSYIFLGIPLLLLGLPILTISYQKWGRDLSIAIPASCGLAFLVWGIWGTLQSLAKTGYIHPFIGATIIHLIFGMCGLYLLYKQDQ